MSWTYRLFRRVLLPIYNVVYRMWTPEPRQLRRINSRYKVIDMCKISAQMILCCIDCAIAAPWMNFDGSYYKVFTADKSFEEAKKYCSDNFCSYLVHFDSSEEVEFVNDLAIRTGVSDYWMGLEYDATDSKWKWVDDNAEATFTDWNPYEPNSLPDQSCTKWSKNEKWDNIECYLLRSFACEKRNSFA